jgi:hypothetical protein
MSQLYDVTTRFWEELVTRLSGPLAFSSLREFTVSLLPTFGVEPARIRIVERQAARETRFIRRG